MTYQETLLNRIKFIKENAERAIATGTEDTSYLNLGIRINYVEMKKFSTSGLSFVLDLYGEEHPYYLQFLNVTKDNYRASVEAGVGILDNIKAEIENGWFFSVKGIISAEIFNDFLEMADHLLEKGYKDAAAVMIGSVLEEHLRQLCLTNEIDISFVKDGKQIPLKADRMNSELTKMGTYNKLDQKNVTALLDLRNKAAHGNYEEYNQDQVKLMYSSVLNFITRHQL